ncbi:MAG: hypothetical protein A3B89_00305 [Candidatus Buchananbacteria bacterium RIFCSPHIGHO2_02_FULL_40_13]|uniref:Uncharacterized protein n=1 Tax=Candidatus Buchananbacteria bacterium RIFCSPLOWO2_01_FULL_39_33 TaxID=1797543 RepID=A0A1G1YH84_9BACT|nr:MAG: hypothetical protein A2820_02945 [Candidatus Buchananbacteria bacterium RIFCSPHIGHO2_01_FULL_40_35]OGY49516.1 MAG: hypothetical protein A3B89_00305 [Candidatus Buchananbacteria bacterium RIFCSPHIGHO2_02_FULL_40_13]OGY51669.1 MAG: hypothetical protein A3A02_00645 [Candidatus Buchananbacteria bacterium RIFCSPLOWO2_01_FULL_39_33]
MIKLTNEMEWLIDIYSRDYSIKAPKDVEKIKLSQMISKLGFFYEKFRNAIDYNDEHLVRRNSLERFLRRQLLLLLEKDPSKISEALIHEFIRAQYLPNDTLPETFILEVAQPIQKYLAIIDYISYNRLPKSSKLIDWLIGITSAEINEKLTPNNKEVAIANLMYSHLIDNIAFHKTNIDKKERDLQIYIATLRTLLKADPSTLRYFLLKLYLPNWNLAEPAEIEHFSRHIYNVKNKIDSHLSHPIGFQLTRNLRPQAVFFNILKEVMELNKDHLKELFADNELLEKSIEEIVVGNYKKIKTKLIGTILRVILYIFFTKTILAFIIELPYDYFILEQIHWYALITNIAFHPLLMFFIAMTIRIPGVKNTQLIIAEIKKIIAGEERKIVFKAKGLMRRGSVSYFIFNTIYIIMFSISFGLIISILNFFNFNVPSGILFVFFLTIVSFFGFRLRNLAKQLSVVPRKDNFFSFLVDFISLPIIRVGRFFSTNFAKINIFLFILDFLIETPFKALVEFLEKAVSFINEKREEIIE